MAYLNGTCLTTPETQAWFLRQGQTEVHELVKGVAEGATVRALQGALQLPCKDVLDDAVAPAVGVLPGFLCLLTHTAFSLQLLVRRLALHPVQFCLHIPVVPFSTSQSAVQSKLCFKGHPTMETQATSSE